MAVVKQEMVELREGDEGWAEAQVMSLITGGRPYVLLMPELITDPDGSQGLKIETRSDITDVEVIKAVLESVLSD